MKLLKKIISVTLTAAILTGVFSTFAFSASAKEKSSIIFDFNNDKVSDKKDIEGVVTLNQKYHAPIVQEMLYGPLDSTEYDTTQADSLPRYFLTNINQCTTPRLQKPLGDCWAQVATGMLESSVLKAQSRLNKTSKKIDSKALGKPIFNGLDNKTLYSPKAVTWFSGEGLTSEENPSQAGEGNVFPDNSNTRFNLGGFMSYSETLYTAWRGVFTEEQYPHQPNDWDGSIEYITEDGSWNLPEKLSGKSFDKAPRVTDALLLPPTSNFESNSNTSAREWKSSNQKARRIIKQAIIDYGAVHIAYDSWGDDACSTVYSDKSSSGSGHAALIVGWDDNFSKDNYKGKSGATPPEDGAWLVKNTFGSYEYMKSHFKNWDTDREGIMGMTYAQTQEYYKERNTSLEQMLKQNPDIQNKYMYESGIRDSEDRGTGFFWIYYCDHSISTHAVYNVDIADDGYDYDNNYQYDYAVNDDDIRFSLMTADTGTLVSNVFTANGNEKLKAFSAYTNATDSTVKTDIYLLNGSESNPTEGKPVYSGENKVKFAGFHTIKLDETISLSKGQKFAIVQNTKSYDKKTDAEVSYLNLETVFDSNKISVGPAKNNVVCNDGETFVRLDGKWTTPKELDESLEIAEIVNFGNAKIKAFTVNEPRETIEPQKPETVSEKTEIEDIAEVIPSDTKTKTIRFYMRDDWQNEYNAFYDGKNLSSCKPCVFWWEGSYNCTAVYGSTDSWPGYSISKTDESDSNIYIAKVPDDVENIIINNTVKTASDNSDLKYYASQTKQLSLLGYDEGDSPYGLYPKGLNSTDNMIYVSGRNDSSAEYSPVENEGAWFYYYGNGKYGVYKTLTEAKAHNALYSNGEFPTKPNTEPITSDTKAKKSNPIKVSAKNKTIRINKLKNKQQSLKLFTVKKAEGKVTYKLINVTKKLKKYVKIKANGIIIIKKWTKAKKGTYNIKVTIKAKGNNNYKNASKTVTAKIRIK